MGIGQVLFIAWYENNKASRCVLVAGIANLALMLLPIAMWLVG